MSEPRTLTPERMPFLWPRIGGAILATVIVSVALLAVSVVFPLALLLLPVAWVVLLGLSVYGANVAYGKERYEVHGDHLVRHYGGLLSDGRSELDVRNITHVRLRLPWLRHKFFDIGDVRVESAGSAQSEITFESVKHPEQLYADIQQVMRDNGYSLKRGEVLHEESPNMVGGLSEVVQTTGGGLFALIWIGFVGLGAIGGLIEELGEAFGALLGLLGLLGGLGVVALLIGGTVVRYLDVVRRTYSVYDDVVEYTEGFLTRDNAFIPFENIADAGTNRTFIDQVVGLYDVSVSCQGSGSEVKFRRLSNGPALQGAINELVARARKVDKPADRKRKKPVSASDTAGEGAEVASDASETEVPAHDRPSRPVVAPEDAWTAELQMNMTRALAQTLPAILLLPLLPIAMIGVAIQASFTRYSIGADGASSEFNFLSTRQVQFAYDKVTGVQVTTNPLDSMFDTLTVQIWSIGSPQPLTLQHVSASAVDLPALLRQCGIPSDAPAQGQLNQSFGAKIWLIQNLQLFIGLVVLALILIPVGFFFPPALLVVPVLLLWPIPSFVLTKMRTERQKVTFHEAHLEAQTGILIRNHVYARYDDIKKVETVSIPFTEQGRFRVYIAGERQVQQGQQGQTVTIPYSITGEYIEDIANRVDAMDALLLGRIAPDAILGTHEQGDDVVKTTQPAVANTAVVMGVICVIVFPLLLWLPFRIWQIKRIFYDIETDRVVRRSGILFKTVTSVLYDRIDSLQQNQGALGKAFGNGTITLLTAGSSRPDLAISDVPDYLEVYDTIRSHYGG
jgi:membrane protein YdbS with pleckstrin-like domain